MSENIEPLYPDLSVFVGKYYEMDPKTEDVLPSGHDLEPGMMVLIEDPEQRSDIQYLRSFVEQNREHYGLLSMARKLNRWCKVEEIAFWDNEKIISFVGVYEDGVKRQRRYSTDLAWIVKKDSVDQGLGFLADALGYSVDQVKANLQKVAQSRGEMFMGDLGRAVSRGFIKVPEYLVDPDPHADGSTKPGTWAEWEKTLNGEPEEEELTAKLVQNERDKQAKWLEEKARFAETHDSGRRVVDGGYEKKEG